MGSGLVHVGAWIGEEYLDHVGRLLLFEPQKAAFEKLKANLVARPGVVLVNAALGAEPGRAQMYRADPDHSSSLLKPKKHLDLYPHIHFKGTEAVWVTTLDRMLSGYGLEGCYDELVLDVQGYELEVLKGAARTLEDITRITTEVNTDETYEGCALMDELDAYLEGFERIETDLHGGIWGDAVYERKGNP